MTDIALYRPGHAPQNDLWSWLGIPSRGPRLYEALQKGLPYRVYARLAELTGLSRQELARVVAIAPATLQRRIKSGRFTQDESDRLYRLAQVFSAASDLFEGDTTGAKTWINEPVRGLGAVRPIDMIATSAQTGAVLDLIGRLEHGVPA